MVKGHLPLALAVVFVATFVLFFIFDSLDRLAQRCEAEEPPQICSQLTGFSFTMLIVLLLISGFVLMILAVGYILIVF